jgi:transposase
MTKEHLATLTHEELIDLILRLQVRVAELEAELANKNRPPKTSSNSSVPPSSERKSNKPNTRKKQGAKPGHVGKSRVRTEPDVFIECKLEVCSGCGVNLQDVEQKVVGSSQVVEIPPIQPVVIEAQRYGCTCPNCGKEQTADYPDGMESERVFGSRLESLVTYLHEIHHMSYARLQAAVRILFGLTISPGGLVNLVKRTARRLRPFADEILDEIKHSPVVGSDETGARVDGKNQWQWVFVTEKATYHVIVPSRGSIVIEGVMGEAQPVVWVRDLWSAQCKGPGKYHQLCHAHQLRDLQYAVDSERSYWAYEMQRLLLHSQRLVKHRGRLPPEIFQREVEKVESGLDDLLEWKTCGVEAQKLQRRYRKHRDSLFVFLHIPDVPYDNNASERALRNSVIHRKVSGGFRSDAGAEAHAVVSSVVDTIRKRGHDVFETLQGHIGSPAPVGG